MQELVSFLLAGLALAGSPGPNTLSLAAAGAAFGVRASLGFMAGLTLGMVAVMAITATGVMGLVLALPGAMPLITAVVAAYFAYLAYRIATAPPLTETSGDGPRPSLAAGIFQSLINPKAYAAMAALFSGFVLVRERLELDMAAKVAVSVAIIAAVNIAWLFGGSGLTRFFRDPRANRAINLTFALLLLASVAFALLF